MHFQPENTTIQTIYHNPKTANHTACAIRKNATRKGQRAHGDDISLGFDIIKIWNMCSTLLYIYIYMFLGRRAIANRIGAHKMGATADFSATTLRIY